MVLRRTRSFQKDVDRAVQAVDRAVETWHRGDERRALRMARVGLQRCERLVGKRHADLAEVLVAVADMERDLGDGVAASRDYARALRLGVHASTSWKVDVMSRLGDTHRRTGRYQEAYAVLRRASSIPPGRSRDTAQRARVEPQQLRRAVQVQRPLRRGCSRLSTRVAPLHRRTWSSARPRPRRSLPQPRWARACTRDAASSSAEPLGRGVELAIRLRMLGPGVMSIVATNDRAALGGDPPEAARTP